MPVTSLHCPNCGGELMDENRARFALSGAPPDYLCPHCDKVLCWTTPVRPLQYVLFLLGLAPLLLWQSILLWEIMMDTTPNTNVFIQRTSVMIIATIFVQLLSFVTRRRESKMLVVKHDMWEKIWEWEAAELKLRSKPGSKW